MNDKEIYAISLDFSKMRFLESNDAVNTTLIHTYGVISLEKDQIKEVLPEIREKFFEFIKEYGKKFPFTNER